MYLYIGLGALLVGYIVYTYNRFVTLHNQAHNAWSQIDVQLKRRGDLIPALTKAAKSYMEHERELFEALAEERSNLRSAKTPQESAAAEEALGDKVTQLLAVAEDYPDLKANENFQDVQREITTTENKIAYARQHYNDVVTAHNTLLESFPSNLVGAITKYNKLELFSARRAE